MTERGKYVVIEGHDGTVKSTQVEMLSDLLSQRGIESITTHEPAGSPVSDELRTIIKNGDLERDPITNLLMFTASRRATWLQMGESALNRGAWVLGARNWYSTMAFQGYGEGLDIEHIRDTTQQYTPQSYWKPDSTIILTMDDEEERRKRIGGRGELENPDTFESKDAEFQKRVYDGYAQIAQDLEIPTVDASPEKYVVAQEIWRIVKRDILQES